MGAAIPPLVMAFVSVFFAAQYFAIYLRTRRPHELLTFAQAALAVSLYDALSAAGYAAATPVAALRLGQVQDVALALISVAMLRFISDHTGYPCRRYVAGMCAGYAVVAVIELAAGAAFTKLVYAVAMSGFVWVALAAIHEVRSGARDRAVRLLSVTGLLLASAVNDLLVVFDVIKSVFTLEYVFMAVVVLMADSLSGELVKAVRVEGALRDSEVRYRTLFESATDAILLLRDGHAVDCNNRTLEMFGCTRDEMLARGPTEFSPALQADGAWSQPAARERLAAARAGEPQTFEWLHTRKDGTLFVAEVSLNRVELGGETYVQTVVRDITERKQAEDESFRSHQMLQFVLDNIPQRVFWKDRSFRFMGCNQAFARDAGLASPEEIVGKDDFKLPWRASAPLYRADDARVMSEDRAKIGFEEPQDRSDGTTSWLRTSKVPLHDPSGKVVGVLGTYEDITDRVLAEEKLRESNEELDRFFSLALDMLCIANTEGYFVRVSSAWEHTLGYTLAELEGTKFTDLVHPDDLPATMAGLAELSAGQQVLNFANRYRRKDGSYRWIEWRSMPYQNRLIYAAARDITERKAGEEALRASEQRFRSLVETTSDWVWETDEDGLYSYSSPKVKEILGYEPLEVIGKSPMDFMPPEEADRVRAEVAGPMAARDPISGVENVNVRKDGRRVVLETSGVPIFGDDGEFLGYRGIDRDVTERRNVEEQLLQSQRMDAIGNLAGGVAHDFNNLLQAMLTNALLLRERAADAERVRELARHLEEEIMRGGALTRQLLVFSRRETTRPGLLDLNEVVRASTSLLGRLLRENIQLTVELPRDPLHVVADRGQLDQVLMNLAVNAADAMPGGGRLAVRTGAGQDHVWLQLSDTGCGIADEIRGRIFEPFFTTKSTGKGTGLGLAVVHGIVTRHGGSVTVHSRPGAGATFTIRLPLAPGGEPAVPPATAEPAASAPRGEGRSILVVEDEEGVRNGLVEILRALDYRVAAAESSAAALRIAADESFDLVLCDLLLPDGSGTEVVAGLVARRPGLKVVLMSGYAQEEAVRLGVTEGKVRFLQKPFDITTLARELDEALAETSRP